MRSPNDALSKTNVLGPTFPLSRPHARPRLPIYLLIVFVTIILTPFNGAAGIVQFGEMGGDPFNIILILTSPIVVHSIFSSGRRPVPVIFSVFVFAILLTILMGFIANAHDILTVSYKGRSGVNKFFTSIMVIFVGMYSSWVVYCAGRDGFWAYYLRPLLITTVVVLLVGAVEFISWHVSVVASAYAVLTKILLSGTASGSNDVDRIQSVTYEASFFGAFVCFILPWLFVARSRAKRFVLDKVFWNGMIVLAIALSAMSGRTAIVGVPITIVFVVLAHFASIGSPLFARLLSLVIEALTLALAIVPILFVLFDNSTIVAALLRHPTTSNLSRYGTVYIMAHLFSSHLLFGVGSGQYGFYVPNMVVDWAYNVEFKKWITDPTASFFPSFSMIVRIAGEFGLFGLIVWLSFIVRLMELVLRAGRRLYVGQGVYPIAAIAIAANLIGIVVYGYSAGSFRVINIWGAIGAALAYVASPFTVEAAIAGASMSLKARIWKPRLDKQAPTDAAIAV